MIQVESIWLQYPTSTVQVHGLMLSKAECKFYLKFNAGSTKREKSFSPLLTQAVGTTPSRKPSCHTELLGCFAAALPAGQQGREHTEFPHHGEEFSLSQGVWCREHMHIQDQLWFQGVRDGKSQFPSDNSSYFVLKYRKAR